MDRRQYRQADRGSNDRTRWIDNQIDEVMIFRDEVSGEVVEAAGLVALGGFPTLPRAGRGPNRPERKRIMLV